MGERWVLGWLRARLEGQDPYLPLDRRSDEDPEARVVGLLRSAGPLDPASRMIGRASHRLLSEASDSGQEPPPFLGPLLRLCQQVQVPDTEAWFIRFVQDLAADPAAMETRWGKALLSELVYAAIQQARATPSTAIHAAWEQLLGLRPYSTQALIALASSFEIEGGYLARWWSVCLPQERARELRHRLSRAAKLEGSQHVREILLARWPSLPSALQTAINAVLPRLGIAAVSVFDHRHGGRALLDVAWKPEIVLARESNRHAAVARG